MTRLHYVKKARRAYPGVRKGQPYWWWKFSRCPKQRSAKRPRRSQLTRSAYLAALYDLEDRVGGLTFGCAEDLRAGADELRDVAGEARTLGEEQEDKRSNMEGKKPSTGETAEYLQYGERLPLD